jgi:uncharacterized protein YeaO (DUF488 family)
MCTLIRVQRVYGSSKKGGYRVLVDRLWPRGLSKEDVQADLWLKEVAPSNELRKWYGHDPARWEEFKERYFKELAGHEDSVMMIEDRARAADVVLLFGSKEERLNNAVALKEYLEKRLGT